MTPAKFGKYVVQRVLGQGAMGVVYEALDPELARVVAVKVLTSPHDDADQRFRREARLIAALRHPHVVTIYDFGTQGGTPYIVMEMLRGATVALDIQRRTPRSIESKVTAMADVCLALDYAHRAGVIHRDVKPANIHLGDDGVIRLLDFGIAHLTGSSLTHTHALVGTPAYLPPEVVAGAPADARSDTYSAAATLYEWLSGVKPYQAPDVRSLLLKVLREPPTPIEVHWPQCPPDLAQCIHKGLAREPADRHADAATLRAALLAAIAPARMTSAPVVATTRSAARPRQRAPRRVSSAFVALGVTLLAGFGTLVVRSALVPPRVPAPAPVAANVVDAKVNPPPPVPPSPVDHGPPSRDPLPPEERPRPSRTTLAVVPAATPDSAAKAETPTDAPQDDDQIGPTLGVGTTLLVSVLNELRTDRTRVGDTFRAELREPVSINGELVLPETTSFVGRVDAVVRGVGPEPPSLAVSLVEMTIRGHAVPIRTGRYRIEAPQTSGGDSVTTLVVGAAVGALVGSAVEGREGAVGGAAAGVLTARGAPRHGPTAYLLGDRLPFKLAQAVFLDRLH